MGEPKTSPVASERSCCSNCAFAEEVSSTLICRRNPPDGDYPQKVDHSSWCGEWSKELPWKLK